MRPAPDRVAPVPYRIARQCWPAALIVAAGAAVYLNSLSGPFIFDDPASIVHNHNVRRLWPIWEAMSAPPGTGMSCRPVAALSLAVNYALDGYNLLGYHIFNAGVHILTALALFGLIHRTLARLHTGWGSASARRLALSAALVYVVHPLATDAINHLTYRHEVLMGLFYLLTLYCFVCGVGSPRKGWWTTAAVVSCSLGMASKENMASAPLMVLLYDRTVMVTSFAIALRSRWPLYLGLAGTWAILAASMASGFRGGLVGYHLESLPPYEYILTQFGVVLHYLRLAIWPHPLVLDYQGWPVAASFPDVWPNALAVGAIGLATCWALWRRRWYGLVGALFFFVLSPTSLIPNAGEVAAEHRMYLPLAGVVLVVVAGGQALLISAVGALRLPSRVRQSAAGLVVVGTVVLLGLVTIRRNQDYRSSMAIWSDTVAKRPDNGRANNNLANELLIAGRIDEAIPYLDRALRIDPNNSQAIRNFGRALLEKGHAAKAIPYFRRALSIKPDLVSAIDSLGNALLAEGQLDEAMIEYHRALRLDPYYAPTHHNLGTVLIRKKKYQQAIEQFTRALELDPTVASSHLAWAIALRELGRPDQALEQCRQALDLDPQSATCHRQMGLILGRQGRLPEAVTAYQQALSLDPDSVDAHYELAHVLVRQGQLNQAIPHYRMVLILKPDSAPAHSNLSDIFFKQHKYAEAATCARKALGIDPALAQAHLNLGNALLGQGNLEEAIGRYRQALRIDPDSADAQGNLRTALAAQAEQ